MRSKKLLVVFCFINASYTVNEPFCFFIKYTKRNYHTVYNGIQTFFHVPGVDFYKTSHDGGCDISVY